jgi:hypothetical protein
LAHDSIASKSYEAGFQLRHYGQERKEVIITRGDWVEEGLPF